MLQMVEKEGLGSDRYSIAGDTRLTKAGDIPLSDGVSVASCGTTADRSAMTSSPSKGVATPMKAEFEGVRWAQAELHRNCTWLAKFKYTYGKGASVMRGDGKPCGWFHELAYTRYTVDGGDSRQSWSIPRISEF